MLSERNQTLAQILVYADRNGCRKKLAVSSKVESVESIVSFLVPKGTSATLNDTHKEKLQKMIQYKNFKNRISAVSG